MHGATMKFMKIPPVEAESFNADGHIDMKLTVAYRNPTNAPKHTHTHTHTNTRAIPSNRSCHIKIQHSRHDDTS